MEATYFTGVEFDWLWNQVASVMWDPDGRYDPVRHEQVTASGARVKMSEAVQWAKPPSAKPQLKVKGPYDEWVSAAAGRERLTPAILRERQDAVTRTWTSTPPKAASMSVEEYNRWRGENPANAAHAPYVFQKYPTTLYKDGNRVKVGNADDHDRLAKEGWKESP